MDISIIIVNYNTADLVLQCIKSIEAKTSGCTYEIIVVDNASQDNSINELSKANINLICSESNLGFGKANNLGAEKAKGKYLFFLNPDTILCNNAVYSLYNHLCNNPQVAAVGGNLFSKEKAPTHSFSRLFPCILQEMDFASMQLFTRIRYGKNRQFNFTGKPLEVAFITGADLMLRKDVFDEVEGFDKEFFMYYEDSALCFKIAKKGYKIVSIPEAEIIHLEGQSFKVSATREERIQNGRYLFFHKFYSTAYNKAADYLNLCSMQMAIFFCYILGKKARHERYSCRYKVYKKVLSDNK